MHRITAPNGVAYFAFDSIPADRVRHAIFTRHGGVSPTPWQSLNFSVTVGDSHETIHENVRRAHAALGLDPARMMDRHLAHTAEVWHVTEADLGREAPLADGIVTRTPLVSLLMTFADCQPILAYDPVRHVLGVAHAGWRGTLAGMARALVEGMVREGSRAADLLTALGPAIGPCCYEVGDEVTNAARAWPDGAAWLREGKRGKAHLDLSAANEAVLRAAGVRHIERAEVCTACHTDDFFSHRAEPPTTGRFAMIAALHPLT